MGSLQSIEIRNFKAFRTPKPILLGGRHLLLYGENGAGKSSLYWALHVFLESEQKAKADLQKYFDPTHKESLVNIHAQPLDNASASLKFTIKSDTGINEDYEISYNEHQTFSKRPITKARLASDFITYRFFFKFSNFHNSDDFDIWLLFEREILPFCVATSGANLSTEWKAISKRHKESVVNKNRGKAAAKDKRILEASVKSFADNLEAVIKAINLRASKFYNDNFHKQGDLEFDLSLSLTERPDYTHRGKKLRIPKLLFIVKKLGVNPRNIDRPQTFLNEAKLTQIAISIRLGASLVNLKQSPLKLLVLDDLLVSLDMSNRMKVVELITGKDFDDYQKIILTHDLGFYEETRRQIGLRHTDWHFNKFTAIADEQCRIEVVKSDFDLAQQYLANDQLSECGNRLRQHVEDNLISFLKSAKAKTGLNSTFDKDKFSSLHSKINEAKNQLAISGHQSFADLLQRQFSPSEISVLLSPDEIDPAKFSSLPKKERGAIVGRLISGKVALQQNIIELIGDSSRKRLNAIKLLDEVISIKDRILNPASHKGVAPLYKKEAEDAIKIIQSLGQTLDAALATL